MAELKKFCKHSDGLGYCDILSDNETRQYCVEGPCPHEELVEYVPVVQAKWKFDHTTIDHFRIVKCSSCEHEAFKIAIYVKEGNYCPFCGARMDGE